MHNKLIKQGKKVLTVGVSLATIAWSVGFAAVPVTLAASSGDLIKIANNSSVYYLGSNMKRYVFPNDKAYFTWYKDFSGVKTISQTELESYPIGGNVTYKPGVRMVKITTDPKVYAVAKNGTLQWVTSEAVAKALYGDMWNKQIDDVPDPFFVNYTIGSDVSSAASYDKATQTAGSATINDDKGLGGTPVAGGSTLTVALSPDTPASGLVFGSAARVPFTIITLTASSDGDITVDSLTVERGNPAQDGAFSNIDLLDGTTMLPLNALSKSLNAAHQAVFGDDFTVKAGTTKKVIVAANMTSGALSSYAGEVPTMSVMAIALKGGATLVGTLPVVGNYQTVNGTLTVGTAAITAGSNNPSAVTKEVGTKDYIVSSIRITNNSTVANQDFKITSVTFTQNGSASYEDLENVRLVNTNTSVVVAKVEKPTSKKISFTGLDVSVKKGNNINLDLRLDIKSGSARDISLDIDQQADLVVYDILRGFNVLGSFPNSSSPYYNAPNTTIGNGKMRVESLTITSTKLPENTKGLLLGKFKFVVEGEKVNITALGFNFTSTTPASGTGAVTNVIAKDKNGTPITSVVDPATLHGVGTLTSQKTATSTDTVTLSVGENEIYVYGDLDSNYTSGDTIQVGVFPEAITLRGDTSGNLITATPSGQVQSTQLTLKPASLTISLDSTPSAQTVVAGSPKFEFARIVLDATDSGSDIRVTQIALRTEGSDTSFMPDMLSTLFVYDGAAEVPYSTKTRACSGATCGTINSTATTTITINSGDLTVTRGSTKIVRVLADVSTATTTGNFRLHLTGPSVSGIDQEASSVSSTFTTTENGSTMTMTGAGTLLISVAQDPKASLAIAGTATDGGKFILDAKYDTLSVRNIGFSVQNPDGGVVGDEAEVATIELWEQGGSAALGTMTVNAANATITPATPISIVPGTSRTFVLKVKWENLVPPATGSPATSGSGIRARLNWFDVKGNSPGSGTVSLSPTIDSGSTNGNFNTFTVFKSIPTVAITAFDGANVISGNVQLNLFKFNVKADTNGPIALGKFTFGVTTGTGLGFLVDITKFELWESTSASSDGSILSNTNDFQIVSVGATSTETIVMARFDRDNNDSTNRDRAGMTEHVIISTGGARYFTLKGTISGHTSTVDDETVSVRLAGDASFAGTAQLPFGNPLDSSGIDGQVDQDDFIWSDLNFEQYTTATATYTAGWFNGYRVPGLADNSSTAQSLTD